MKKKLIALLVLLVLLNSCNNAQETDNREKWKQQILKTEENFEKMVQSKGIHNAFLAFADNDATLIRSNKLVKGHKGIDSLYKEEPSKNLRWKAEFVKVSKSGDLGFTYGTYSTVYKDSTGKQVKDFGVFSTIWKRQKDETWKFILD
ncbi:uncharacterized protein DUF4440 [Gelidibacter algens]|uniref:Uncharacterized protein DUF4440 n=1 Tax=Gelidibacter algens TaxID=49280 RepID=A0A1A7R0S5_9FLAO|nr:nuclear transport factor 2 family protein [Gelidibacter algens]OBX25123.1 hypothetical protein A9996_11500 [Gelidibacter algens]RAJ20011.1 uncharacterized protein DUF4440 [Gelidibacter algens]